MCWSKQGTTESYQSQPCCCWYLYALIMHNKSYRLNLCWQFDYTLSGPNMCLSGGKRLNYWISTSKYELKCGMRWGKFHQNESLKKKITFIFFFSFMQKSGRRVWNPINKKTLASLTLECLNIHVFCQHMSLCTVQIWKIWRPEKMPYS